MQTGESTTIEVGLNAVLKRGRVDVGLERRAGLAQRVGRAVELARAVVAPADHRAHRAVEIRDHDGGLAGAVFVAVLPQRILPRSPLALQIRTSSAVRTMKKRSVTDFGKVSTSFFISSNAQSR